MRTILFISHDASRTGAPMVLLHFLRWFKAHSNVPFQILLKEDGPLAPEFRLLAPTTVYSQLNRRVTRNLLQRLLRKMGLVYQADYHSNPLLNLYQSGDIGLVYANTITNGNLLAALAHLKCPVITHVHELSYTIQCNGPGNLEQVRSHTTHFIACSRAVQQNLIGNLAVPINLTSVVHEFVPASLLSGISPSTESVRKKHNLPPESFVVGGAGCGSWRKGWDLFVQLALVVTQGCPDKIVRFVWVGKPGSNDDLRRMEHDLNQSGLNTQVQLVGEVSNPLDYFAAMDAFVLTSREDPFPLVCLEAALLAKPIICFDKAGGMPEFVEDDCGFIVPYLDIQAMADKIRLLMESRDLCQRLGHNAKRKVLARHTTEVAAPQLASIIEKVMCT